MQWLIDLIIDAIGVPPCYIDRGDNPAFDWGLGDTIQDNTWYPLDLSGIIPTTATAVVLNVEMGIVEVQRIFQVKPRIASGVGNIGQITSQVGTSFIHADLVVSVGTNRTIVYRFGPGTWLSWGMSVKGWIL